MQQLHLVGFTADNRGLIFSARKGSKSGGFVVTLDDKLLARVDEIVARREIEAQEEQSSGRPKSTLSPREIQARLRAGRTIAQVAREADVDEEWVARWAAPILAEQAQVVERAQELTMEKSRVGPSAVPLGEAVRWNMADKGIVFTDAGWSGSWDAFHLRGNSWMVRFTYVYRKATHQAEWEVETRDAIVISRNRQATDLGYVAPGRRRPKMPRSMLAAVDLPETAPAAKPSAPSNAPSAPTASRGRKSTAPSKAASAKRAAAKKAAVKRAAAKSAAVKKAAAKKSAAAAKKAAAKKIADAKRAAEAKKVAAKKEAAKRAAAKKAAAAKREASRKAAAKKAAARQSAAKKAVAKKATAKKSPSKKAAAKKTRATRATATTKRSTPRKSAPRKATPRKATTRGARKTTSTGRSAAKRRPPAATPRRETFPPPASPPARRSATRSDRQRPSPAVSGRTPATVEPPRVSSRPGPNSTPRPAAQPASPRTARRRADRAERQERPEPRRPRPVGSDTNGAGPGEGSPPARQVEGFPRPATRAPIKIDSGVPRRGDGSGPPIIRADRADQSREEPVAVGARSSEPTAEKPGRFRFRRGRNRS